MALDGLILISSAHFHQQRSKNAVFHLLKGKRSIQTVQDAYLFGLHRLYGVCPSITVEQFKASIQSCLRKKFFKKETIHRQIYLKLTPLGEEQIISHWFPFNYLNGLKFFSVDEMFMNRLLLFIQVLTNRYKNNRSYIPIVDDALTTRWMKGIYPHIRNNVRSYMTALYKELYDLLSRFSNKEARILTDRLTGYKVYGLGLHQLADRYRLSKQTISLYLRAIVHRLFHFVQRQKEDFNVLSLLIEDLPKDHLLTRSAQKTYKLLKENYNVETIAKRRRLKQSTILDHLVEIAWYDQSFSIQPYVSQQHILKVENALVETQSLQLKKLKEVIGSEMTYFQIRLALTRIKNALTKGVFIDP